MNCEQAIAVLRRHDRELKADGVLAISISAPRRVEITGRTPMWSSQFASRDFLDRRSRLSSGVWMNSNTAHVIEGPARKDRLQAQIDRDRSEHLPRLRSACEEALRRFSRVAGQFEIKQC
jgi:hypothetical protein